MDAARPRRGRGDPEGCTGEAANTTPSAKEEAETRSGPTPRMSESASFEIHLGK